jgi:hypothetical protein
MTKAAATNTRMVMQDGEVMVPGGDAKSFG